MRNIFFLQPTLGTNPISVAAPSKGDDFVLDMATSTAAVGKVNRIARTLFRNQSLGANLKKGTFHTQQSFHIQELPK